MHLTEDEWRARLTLKQFYILREKGTERANSGALLHNKKYKYSIAVQVVMPPYFHQKLSSTQAQDGRVFTEACGNGQAHG